MHLGKNRYVQVNNTRQLNTTPIISNLKSDRNRSIPILNVILSAPFAPLIVITSHETNIYIGLHRRVTH